MRVNSLTGDKVFKYDNNIEGSQVTEYLGGVSWVFPEKTPLRDCFTVRSSPNETPVGLCNTCDKADLTVFIAL